MKNLQDYPNFSTKEIVSDMKFQRNKERLAEGYEQLKRAGERKINPIAFRESGKRIIVRTF